MGDSSLNGSITLRAGHLKSLGGRDSCTSWLKLGGMKASPSLALCSLGIHHNSHCPFLSPFPPVLLTDCSCVSLSALPGGHLNLTAACNAQCGCLQENYSPVCGTDDIMYYSPCHAGCRKVSEDLRNGKKVGLKALWMSRVVAHLWSDLVSSEKGLSFAANQCKMSQGRVDALRYRVR